MHLHNCRCSQEHLRMLLQSPRALCIAPGGPGSIWNDLEAPVRSAGVSWRFACGFRTDLHFADVAQPLYYTRCNTQNHWHSVDTLLTRVWMLCWRSIDALLTLCWCSVCGVAVSTHRISPIKAANTSIMGKCRSTALGLYKMQHTKSLTLCWRSFSDWGCDYVAISFAHNGCQYVDSGYMP